MPVGTKTNQKKYERHSGYREVADGTLKCTSLVHLHRKEITVTYDTRQTRYAQAYIKKRKREK